MLAQADIRQHCVGYFPVKYRLAWATIAQKVFLYNVSNYIFGHYQIALGYSTEKNQTGFEDMEEIETGFSRD